MKTTLSLLAILTASTSLAQESRQLSAHEHGVGALNIAFDSTTVGMEFHAPGADIVGFEYAPKSDADRVAVGAAIALLEAPMDLFVVPTAAECSVVQASADLEQEHAHEDHDDHEHADEHDHDHADEHEEHAHEEHEHNDAHEEHDHDHDHDAHEEHDHEGEAEHAEFHADYTLNCAVPEALTEITFAYFDQFENAREVMVQVITPSGAQAYDVERDAPTLDLRDLF